MRDAATHGGTLSTYDAMEFLQFREIQWSTLMIRPALAPER